MRRLAELLPSSLNSPAARGNGGASGGAARRRRAAGAASIDPLEVINSAATYIHQLTATVVARVQNGSLPRGESTLHCSSVHDGDYLNFITHFRSPRPPGQLRLHHPTPCLNQCAASSPTKVREEGVSSHRSSPTETITFWFMAILPPVLLYFTHPTPTTSLYNPYSPPLCVMVIKSEH